MSSKTDSKAHALKALLRSPIRTPDLSNVSLLLMASRLRLSNDNGGLTQQVDTEPFSPLHNLPGSQTLCYR